MILSDPSFVLLVTFLFFLFGAIFGSFGNVVIARYPEGESVVWPHSRCPRCKTPIKFYDNIPIVSFLVLKARCRSCHEPISWRYPIIEFLCGLLFAGCYIKYGYSVTTVEACIFCWAGVVASAIDMDHRILPDIFTLSGIVIGIIGAFINPERHVTDSLIGLFAGGGFLYAVAYIYMAIRNEEGMGGGDIKLIAWIGAVMGWRAVIFSILVSSIAGSIFGTAYAALKKSGLKTAIPFGPFLVFAAILYLFLGQPLMHAYLSVFFPFTE